MEQRTEHIYTAQQCHTQTQNTPPDFISYGPYREYRYLLSENANIKCSHDVVLA